MDLKIQHLLQRKFLNYFWFHYFSHTRKHPLDFLQESLRIFWDEYPYNLYLIFLINFSFSRTMVAYKPWLTIDVIAIPGPTHPFPQNPQKFLPKYDPNDDVLLE